MTSLSSFTRLVAASAVLGTLALSAQAASIVKSSGATTPVLSEFGPAFANAPNKTGYGGTQPDRMFVETFRLSCPKGQKVTKALFNIQVIKLTQGPNRGDNDALALWKGGPNAVYNTYLWQAADPAGTSKVVSLDLDALPPIGTSSSPSGVINSPAGGHGLILVSNMSLSFSVQDDTMVKQASLEYACGLDKTDGGIGNAGPSGGLLDGALVATEATAVRPVDPVPAAPNKKGMTWGVYPHDDITGVAHVACQGQPGPDCNAYLGDQLCSAKLPVLCIDLANLPKPATDADAAHWSGGVIATTPAVPGAQFQTKADADAYCKVNFGPAFEVAEFHMQPGRIGWKFDAYGNVGKPGKERAWVHIDNQANARCWN